MIHPRILLFISFLSAVSAIYGQTGFRPGYIIDTNHDTIRGVIDDRGEVQNSRACLYRASELSESVEFLPEEISAYRFEEGKSYVSRTIDLNGLEQMVFIECLVKGVASLYYFRNEDTELYLIEKEGEKMLALTNDEKEVMINGTATRVYTKRYIRLLKATFYDCLEIQSFIDQAKLNHRSLKSITCKYNDYVSNGESCIVYDQTTRFRLRVGPVIGFSSNHLSMTGDRTFDSFDFDNSNDPVLGVMLDLSSSRLGNHLSFQLGTDLGKSDFHSYLEVQSTSSSVVMYYYDAYLQALSMNIYGGPKYSFTRGRVRPNLGGGLMFHKYIQPDFWYVRETHILDLVTIDEWHGDIASNLFFGAYVQAGIDVDLTRKMILFANIKGGFCITNPKTIAGLDNGMATQIRIRSELIPITFSMGLLF